MIRHIVAFRLRAADAPGRTAAAERIRDELESLRDVIEEIADIHVGIDLGILPEHWHVVLVSDFADGEELDRYQKHPEHVRAAQTIAPLVSDRAVVDYVLYA